MEDTWEAEPPAARFMRLLVKQRAEQLMRDKEYLKTLRCNYPVAKALQKRFGDVWSEFGTNIFQLIAGSCDEDWDAEDEEKHAFAQQSEKKTSPMILKENTRDDNVVAACEEGARSGLDQLQGKPETGLGELEEAEEGEKTRGEGFYRRAGGTGT
jgi:hypothetical protein